MDDADLIGAFRRTFGSGGTLRLSRAPGRVNLMGDHVDYLGLPVLPMALERSVRVVFRPRSDAEVHVHALQPSGPPASLRLGEGPPRWEAGDWRNYLSAAVVGVDGVGEPRGLDAVVAGDVPVAAGLSSSSALVVALGQALLHCRERALPVDERMERFARAERFVGTEGGGMDQAASLGGKRGHALQIRFDPVRVSPIRLPDSWRFLVIDTGRAAQKSGGAQDAYNARVAWAEEARSRLAGGQAGDWPSLIRARGVEELEVRAAEITDGPVRGVALHVLREQARVEACVDHLANEDAPAFAAAMRESHASLWDDCGVGWPEADVAVRMAADAGARATRMTGAGLGGSVVVFTDAAQADDVEAALAGSIRRALPPGARVFRVRAGGGAEVRALATH